MSNTGENKADPKILIEIDDIIFNLYSITEDERKIIISYVKDQIYYFKNIYD